MKHNLSFTELKEKISLLEFAQVQGYKMNRSKSTKRYPVLDGPTGDTLVVKTAGAHQPATYFNATEGMGTRDRGDLVEFVKQRLHSHFRPDPALSLYDNVNKILHDYLSLPFAQKQPFLAPALYEGPTTEKEFSLRLYNLKPYDPAKHTYLSTRGITDETVRNDLFRGRITVNNFKGNIYTVFPFYYEDAERIGGLNFRAEQSNTNAAFSNHQRGLWMSKPGDRISSIILTESPIDALSHHQLYKPVAPLYVANFGQPTLEQYHSLFNGTLARLQSKLEQNFTVVSAYDNDLAGAQYNTKLLNVISGGQYHISLEHTDGKRNIVLRVFPFEHLHGKDPYAYNAYQKVFAAGQLKPVSPAAYQHGIEGLINVLSTHVGDGSLSIGLNGHEQTFKIEANAYMLHQFNQRFADHFYGALALPLSFHIPQGKDFNIELIGRNFQSQKDNLQEKPEAKRKYKF